MSEIDKLLDVVQELDLHEAHREIETLRAVMQWSVSRIGIDYKPGDEVTIISDVPAVAGSGWSRYQGVLEVGAKGLVKGITFNRLTKQWVADVEIDSLRSVDDNRPKRFHMNAQWLAKDPNRRQEASEMEMLASELCQAEDRLVYAQQCCEIIERGAEPSIPLRQVRRLLESPSWCAGGRSTVDALGGPLGASAISPRPEVYEAFLEVVSSALADWHADVPDAQAVAKHAYVAQKVAQLHAELVARLGASGQEDEEGHEDQEAITQRIV